MNKIAKKADRKKTQILVLYYSAFGYVAVLARAIAEGSRSSGAVVDIKRIPEIASGSGKGRLFDPPQEAALSGVDDLADYDAIIVGSPTRFGRLAAPVAAFLEQAGELDERDILRGKVAGAFTSPTARSGGQESASLSILNNLLHFGMIVVGPPYSATNLTDESGQRYPSDLDLARARDLGKLIATTAIKLATPARSAATQT